MKNRSVYLFLLLVLVASLLKSQSRSFDLVQGSCQVFNRQLYCFGIAAKKQKATFCVYRLDRKLNITDSLIVEAKGTPDSYLQTYADTLHDYLNIYFHKKEKKEVTILRLNKKLEVVANIENTEVARLNNTSMFSGERFYFKNSVYSIKTEADTSGKQFYLNKYTLRSGSENFDYEFRWQFPFERKNIQSAHIFFANKDHVLLFVNVDSGTKAGQWILRISSEFGKLEKASKLNEKDDKGTYFYGCSTIDKNYKSIHLAGQKFSAAQYDPKGNKLAIANAPQATLYYVELDSLGEIALRQDFKVPVNDIKTGTKKAASGYLIRTYDLVKSADGKVSFNADVFRSQNSTVCYLYANSLVFSLLPNEDKLAMEKNVIQPNPLIEQYYASTDKLDMNGRLCTDSLSPFEKLFYRTPAFPVKLAFKLDADKNPLWLLSKHTTTKKNAVNYSSLGPVKKIYQVSSIEEIGEASTPLLLLLSPASFVISSQPEEGKFLLKLYSW